MNTHVTAIICANNSIAGIDAAQRLQAQERPPDTTLVITSEPWPAGMPSIPNIIAVPGCNIGMARNIGIITAPPETTHIWWVDDDIFPAENALRKMLDTGATICTNWLIPTGQLWWKREQIHLNQLRRGGTYLYAPMSSYLIQIDFCTMVPPTTAGEDVYQNAYALMKGANFATVGHAAHIQRRNLSTLGRLIRRAKHLWGAIDSLDLSGGWALRPPGKDISILGAIIYMTYRAKFWATIALGIAKAPRRHMAPKLSAYFELGRVDTVERWAAQAADAIEPNLNILEVGAGMGGTSNNIGRRHIHIEANSDLIPHLRRRHPNCEIINARYGDSHGIGTGDYTNQFYHGGGGISLNNLPGEMLIMDCEGSERHLNSEDLARFKFIILEVHLKRVNKREIYAEISKTHRVKVVYWNSEIEIIIATLPGLINPPSNRARARGIRLSRGRPYLTLG